MFPTAFVSLFLCTLVFLAALLVLIRKRHGGRRKGLNLPPGRMGWPLVGETTQFAKYHPTTSIGEFMEERIKRYGRIYKTHLMGKPTIMSADLEFNQFILKNDDRLFGHDWPKAYEKIFGKTLPEMVMGDTYHSLKNISHDFLCIPRLQTHFFATFELYTLQVLDSWEENVPFPAFEETKKVTFHMILKSILSLNPGDAETMELQRLYTSIKKGISCLPIDLPGTGFREAIKSREGIIKIVQHMKEERVQKRKKGGCTEKVVDSDYLDMLLERSSLTAEQLVNYIIGMLFAGHETSSLALAFAVYFLASCPKAIQELREEHLAIDRKKKERDESHLTWEDYKQMEFTQCVVNETMRLSSITRYVFRKTKTDVQFKGYDIPSGWSVMPVFAALHLDDNAYEKPQHFDPWRWQDNSSCTYKKRMQNYMPFSQGIHRCGGMELTKMEFAIFLHHLVLKYDWELVGTYCPLSFFGVSDFPKGLPIKVHAVQT